MKPAVSIIVPVYNGEKTLERCVDSVLKQEYKDFELFLINDGSSDKTREICERYAAADDRVLVIHKENSGVSESRNMAIAQAHGEYLQFLDCDDWITPDATKLLVRAAKEYGVALEVNNSSLLPGNSRIHCWENYQEMLKWCQKLQVPVILSSDAHDPLYVGGFDRVEKLLEEEGFDETLVLNTSEEKVWKWIGKEIPDGMITERGF